MRLPIRSGGRIFAVARKVMAQQPEIPLKDIGPWPDGKLDVEYFL